MRRVVLERRRFGKVSAAVAAAGLGLVLSGCVSGGGSSLPDRFFAMPSQQKPTGVAANLPPDYFLQNEGCPEVEIRSGAEILSIRDPRTSTDPASIRYSASIRDVARECRTEGGVMRIKVGIAGRVIAGPKGKAGPVTIPMRVAVIADDKPLYSQLRQVSVTLVEPALNSEFTLVDDQVVFSVPVGDETPHLYVGFDDGQSQPGARPQAAARRR